MWKHRQQAKHNPADVHVQGICRRLRMQCNTVVLVPRGELVRTGCVLKQLVHDSVRGRLGLTVCVCAIAGAPQVWSLGLERAVPVQPA